MKNHISDGLQIIVAIVITGSTVFAMQPPKVAAPSVTQNDSVPTAQVAQPEPAQPQETVVEAPKPVEPVVEAPKVEKAPVQAPVAPKPVAVAISGTKQDWMAQAGIPETDWQAADYIINKESRWCPTRWNGYYGECLDYDSGQIYGGSNAYGLGQALPPSKMAVYGEDWKTNPVTQLRWASDYARDRYGGWKNAANFWTVNKYW